MEVVLGRGSGSLTGPLQDGICIRQSFVAKASILESVAILFSTYKRSNPGTIIVELLENNRPLTSCVYPSSELVDNAYREFPLSAELIEGSEYEFRVSTRHCRAGMSPTAHYGLRRGEGYLLIGNRRVNGELSCKVKYTEDDVLGSVAIKNDSMLSQFASTKDFLVSIVVLNKNHPELILKCVDSLKRYAGDCEVIIGDTGTTDERVLGEYECLPDNFKVVYGLDYHFSKNNNLLVSEHATGTHLLFLNNDVFLEEGCLERMMEYISCFKFGAVGLRLLKERGVVEHDGQLLWNDNTLRTPDHENVNQPPSRLSNEDAVTQGVTAACMLTRRDLFNRLDGFDESYEDVYQDCDYCMKLVTSGFLCATVRSRSALHIGSATRGVTTNSTESVNRDRKKYVSKWRGFSIPPRPLFSFITCCNDAGKYMGMVRSIPEHKGDAVDVIPIVNYGNRVSITRALNIGKMAADGKWLVYCHQDVLYPKGWVRDMRTIMFGLERKGKIGVVGFEGLAKGGTPYSCMKVNPNSPVKVQTLDELCLVTPSRLSFDEMFPFHYYGADFCLTAEKEGMTNYIVGLHVEHLSGGRENVLKDVEGFKGQAALLRKKWPDFDFYTTTTKFIDSGIYYMMLPEVLNEQD